MRSQTQQFVDIKETQEIQETEENQENRIIQGINFCIEQMNTYIKRGLGGQGTSYSAILKIKEDLENLKKQLAEQKIELTLAKQKSMIIIFAFLFYYNDFARSSGGLFSLLDPRTGVDDIANNILKLFKIPEEVIKIIISDDNVSNNKKESYLNESQLIALKKIPDDDKKVIFSNLFSVDLFFKEITEKYQELVGLVRNNKEDIFNQKIIDDRLNSKDKIKQIFLDYEVNDLVVADIFIEKSKECIVILNELFNQDHFRETDYFITNGFLELKELDKGFDEKTAPEHYYDLRRKIREEFNFYNKIIYLISEQKKKFLEFKELYPAITSQVENDEHTHFLNLSEKIKILGKQTDIKNRESIKNEIHWFFSLSVIRNFEQKYLEQQTHLIPSSISSVSTGISIKSSRSIPISAPSLEESDSIEDKNNILSMNPEGLIGRNYYEMVEEETAYLLHKSKAEFERNQRILQGILAEIEDNFVITFEKEEDRKIDYFIEQIFFERNQIINNRRFQGNEGEREQLLRQINRKIDISINQYQELNTKIKNLKTHFAQFKQKFNGIKNINAVYKKHFERLQNKMSQWVKETEESNRATLLKELNLLLDEQAIEKFRKDFKRSHLERKKTSVLHKAEKLQRVLNKRLLQNGKWDISFKNKKNTIENLFQFAIVPKKTKEGKALISSEEENSSSYSKSGSSDYQIHSSVSSEFNSSISSFSKEDKSEGEIDSRQYKDIFVEFDLLEKDMQVINKKIERTSEISSEIQQGLFDLEIEDPIKGKDLSKQDPLQTIYRRIESLRELKETWENVKNDWNTLFKSELFQENPLQEIQTLENDLKKIQDNINKILSQCEGSVPEDIYNISKGVRKIKSYIKLEKTNQQLERKIRTSELLSAERNLNESWSNYLLRLKEYKKTIAQNFKEHESNKKILAKKKTKLLQFLTNLGKSEKIFFTCETAIQSFFTQIGIVIKKEQREKRVEIEEKLKNLNEEKKENEGRYEKNKNRWLNDDTFLEKKELERIGKTTNTLEAQIKIFDDQINFFENIRENISKKISDLKTIINGSLENGNLNKENIVSYIARFKDEIILNIANTKISLEKINKTSEEDLIKLKSLEKDIAEYLSQFILEVQLIDHQAIAAISNLFTFFKTRKITSELSLINKLDEQKQVTFKTFLDKKNQMLLHIYTQAEVSLDQLSLDVSDKSELTPQEIISQFYLIKEALEIEHHQVIDKTHRFFEEIKNEETYFNLFNDFNLSNHLITFKKLLNEYRKLFEKKCQEKWIDLWHEAFNQDVKYFDQIWSSENIRNALIDEDFAQIIENKRKLEENLNKDHVLNRFNNVRKELDSFCNNVKNNLSEIFSNKCLTDFQNQIKTDVFVLEKDKKKITNDRLAQLFEEIIAEKWLKNFEHVLAGEIEGIQQKWSPSTIKQKIKKFFSNETVLSWNELEKRRKRLEKELDNEKLVQSEVVKKRLEEFFKQTNFSSTGKSNIELAVAKLTQTFNELKNQKKEEIRAYFSKRRKPWELKKREDEKRKKIGLLKEKLTLITNALEDYPDQPQRKNKKPITELNTFLTKTKQTLNQAMTNNDLVEEALREVFVAKRYVFHHLNQSRSRYCTDRKIQAKLEDTLKFLLLHVVENKKENELDEIAQALNKAVNYATPNPICRFFLGVPEELVDLRKRVEAMNNQVNKKQSIQNILLMLSRSGELKPLTQTEQLVLYRTIKHVVGAYDHKKQNTYEGLVCKSFKEIKEEQDEQAFENLLWRKY